MAVEQQQLGQVWAVPAEQQPGQVVARGWSLVLVALKEQGPAAQDPVRAVPQKQRALGGPGVGLRGQLRGALMVVS